MSTQGFSPSEGDVPVNPYSLIEAVNAAAADVRRGRIAFLALLAYVAIALAGVGHQDLLLARGVTLPFLQAPVGLKPFFLLAPLVVCLVHAGVLLQHALLARKVLEFHAAVLSLEASESPRHPLRLELHSDALTQSLAGPVRSPLMSFCLRTQVWLTLLALPVLVLLAFQVAFLPYHDVGVTWAQRLIVVVDLACLATIGLFLIRPDDSHRAALARTLRVRPAALLASMACLAGVLSFSMLSATVPGEAMDRFAPLAPDWLRQAVVTAFPLLRDPHADTALGFRRNLVVMDADLAGNPAIAAGQRTLNLRGRDLRHARLDRSDLHQVDFTGADLEGADLSGADLTGARLGCLDPGALRSGDRPAAGCTALKGARLVRTKAAGAVLTGADLSGAHLGEALLDGAEMSDALLQGAILRRARLARAELSNASLQGANLAQIQAPGAQLSGAGLQGADISAAGLQGAILRATALEGANLSDTDLEGADLAGARLVGAKLAGARLAGADLQGARIWQTQATSRDAAELADLSDVRLRLLEAAELAALASLIAKIGDLDVKARVGETVAAVLDKGSAERWRNTPEFSTWQALVSANGRSDGESYRSQLTGYLANLGCRPRWSHAAVASGLAVRAAGARFKGHRETLGSRLAATDCAGARLLAPHLLQSLLFPADDPRAPPSSITGAGASSARPGTETTGSALPVPFPVPAASGR